MYVHENYVGRDREVGDLWDVQHEVGIVDERDDKSRARPLEEGHVLDPLAVPRRHLGRERRGGGV